MIRKIIKIDEQKCDGCGLCIPGCPEGALQLIDGKAKLVSDIYCDGLGACLGHCPQGAIEVIERNADDYDEHKVIDHILKQGEEVLHNHLEHLKEQGEEDLLAQAKKYLSDLDQSINELEMFQPKPSGCPGSRNQSFLPEQVTQESPQHIPSMLGHWPVQMHLISPMAPQYAGSDLVLAADCVAYALGDFHQNFLKGKSLTIACPKLDQNQDIYFEKLKHLIDDAKINTLNVIIMEVPCCSGLLNMAQRAVQSAARKIPLKAVVVGVRGQILHEQWV